MNQFDSLGIVVHAARVYTQTSDTDAHGCIAMWIALFIQDEVLQERRDLLRGFVGCDYRMHLEIDEVAPIRHPLVQ